MMNETLGGIMAMGEEPDPVYIPLEDFITEQIMKDGKTDFDATDLVLEYIDAGGGE
jgi:hypothetical protein